MQVWASFYVPNLRYHLKHIGKYFPIGTKFNESLLSQNLNGRFSLNVPDSYMAMRWIICASLGEFLCAKLEISLKTQKNIFRSEQNLTKVDYLKI